MSSSKKPITNYDIADVRRNLNKQIILALALLGFPAVVASLLRISDIGFHPIMVVHITVYLVNLTLLILFNRLSTKWASYCVLSCIYFIGIAGIYTFGISGIGILILSCFCIATAIIRGKRSGFWAIAFSLMSLFVMAYLTINQLIVIKIDLNEYTTLLNSWFLTVLGFALFVTIIVNGSGNVEAFLNSAVTELTKQEANLKHKVKQRTALMEQAIDSLDGVLTAATQTAIIATDIEGKVTLFNTGAEFMLGYHADELIGQQTPALWHCPLEIEQRGLELTNKLGYLVQGFEVFVALARTQVAEELEWTFIHKNGSRKKVTLVVTAMRDSKNNIVGFLGCAIDITEKQQALDALQQNEVRLRTMVENVPGITYRCVHDKEWTMTFISNAVEDLLGYPAYDFINNNKRSYASIIHPDDVKHVAETVDNALEKQLPFYIEYRVYSADNKIHWVAERGQSIKDSQKHDGCLDGIIIDITEQKLMLSELQASQARYSSIIESVPNIVMRLSIEGNIEFTNRGLGSLSKQQLINKNVYELISDENKLHLKQAIEIASDEKKKQTIDIKVTSKHGNDLWYQLKIGPIIEGKTVNGLTLVATNINNLIEREQYNKHLALHDHLTGLPNRRLFEEKLDFYIKQSARSGDLFALLLLDLDNFKPVNDNYGHDFGDELLKQLAGRLTSCTRKSDLIARLGGDEFVVIVSNIKNVDAIDTVANSIIATVNDDFVVNGINISIGISIGIAIFPSDAREQLPLIKLADKALYKAKHNGRNQAIYARNT